MKNRIAAVLAALALCLGLGAVSAAPASADADWSVPLAPAVAQSAQGSCLTGGPYGADVSGCKFWTGKTLCVDGSGINGAYYRVATIAQAWNNAVGSPNVFALDYSNDCAADGYPPSRRMVVDGYYGDPNDGICEIMTNVATTDGGNNFAWWTQGPAVYIDFNATCVRGQANRDKAVSIAIGRLIGLDELTSSGFSSRVMYTGSGAVTMPDANSALTVYRIYAGYWGN